MRSTPNPHGGVFQPGVLEELGSCLPDPPADWFGPRPFKASRGSSRTGGIACCTALAAFDSRVPSPAAQPQRLARACFEGFIVLLSTIEHVEVRAIPALSPGRRRQPCHAKKPGVRREPEACAWRIVPTGGRRARGWAHATKAARSPSSSSRRSASAALAPARDRDHCRPPIGKRCTGIVLRVLTVRIYYFGSLGFHQSSHDIEFYYARQNRSRLVIERGRSLRNQWSLLSRVPVASAS